MPCMEITIPKIESETKKDLAVRLTNAFTEAAGFSKDIFSMRFCEYDIGESATAGNLWDGHGIPYLHFLLYCPRISRSKKQRLVEMLTRTFTDCLSKPDWKPIIHICEHPYDNIGVEGKLLSDKYEELAKKKFYYDLTNE